MSTHENPVLPPLVRALAWPVLLVLVFGCFLFLAPSLVVGRWPWKIPPFNARFLGAIYLAEAAAVSLFIYYNRWSPGRLSLIVAVLFTLPATLGTLLHIDQLAVPSKRTFIWFFLYGIYVVLPLMALWHYRNVPSGRLYPISPSLASASLATGVIVFAYGLLMFASPQWGAGFWPWPVDGLHGRVYSGIFLAAGFGLTTVAGGAAREEIVMVASAVIVLGAASIVGALLASAATGRPLGSSLGTIVWFASFAWLATLAAQLLYAATRSDLPRHQ